MTAQDAPAAASLRHNRDYVGWLAGESLSALGSSLSTFAYPLLILFTTGSATRTGIVAAAGNLGSLATLVVGGTLADRWSRRLILLVGPAVQALVVASVGVAVLSDAVTVAHVAAAGFVDGAVVGVTWGAGRAALRRLVPPQQYPVATSQLHARDMTVRVVGPPLGGVLFAAARALPFLADALSYLASMAGVAAVRRGLGPDRADGAARESMRSSIAAGWRFLAGNGYLRFVAGWAAAMNMLGGGLLLLLLLLVRARGGSPTVIGGSQAIAAVGGILGAMVSSRVIRRYAGRSVVIALSWSMVAAAIGMATIPTPWGIGASLAIVYFLAVPLNVVLEAYEMQIIPDAMIGRVSAAMDLLANGFRWLTPICVGLLVEHASAPTAAFVWAGAFAVVALGTQASRHLHMLDRPIETVGTDSDVEPRLA